MEDKVLNAVMLTTSIPTNQQDLFIVWSCYILGNRKFIVGMKNSNNYFEVTYNKEKDEWYVDEYTKVQNKCISNETLNQYTKINSKI